MSRKVLIVSVSKTGIIIGEKVANTLTSAGYEVKHFCREEYAEGHPSCTAYRGQASEVIRSNYSKDDAIVAVMALGGLVRILAPLLRGKFDDPAVVVTDDSGKYVVSLLSGHHGGANELAKLVAEATGGTAVITTATESLGKISLEEVSIMLRCQLMNREAVLPINAAIVNGKSVVCVLVANLRKPVTDIGGVDFLNVENVEAAAKQAQRFSAAIVVSRESIPVSSLATPTAWLKPLSTIMGVGSVKEVDQEIVVEAISAALSKAGLDAKEIDNVVSIKDEPGITGACKRLGLKFLKIQPQEIASFSHRELSPISDMAMKAYGVPGVAEPVALWLAGKDAHLLLRKVAYERKVTVAIAEGAGRDGRQTTGTLYLVGVGPGSPLYLTHAAERALTSVELVAGYSLPLSTIRHLLDGKETIEFSYKHQEEGLKLVAQHLEKGEDVCFVFTGDSCFSEAQLSEKLRRLSEKVEIIPGISSTQIAAAKSGVPLEKALVVTFHASGNIESGKRMLLEGLRGKTPAIVIPRPWDFMPKEIAEYLIDNGVSSEAPVCIYERLTLPDESIFKGTLGALTHANKSFDDLSVMVIDWGAFHRLRSPLTT